jgi:hypothetical protein
MVLFSFGYWLGERQEKLALAAGISRSRNEDGVPQPVLLAPTPEMKEFLQNRTILAQKLAQIRNQGQSNGSNTAPGAAIIQTEMEKYELQNTNLLKRQIQLSQIIAQQQAQLPLPEPSPLAIPTNATPLQVSYLILRDKLVRSRMEMMNQIRSADPETRATAIQHWQQQNAGLIQQVQEKDQALSTAH